MNIKTYLTILLLLSTLSLFSQEIRKYNNDFLNIGIGARALALANTTTASTNDVTSAFWNPAGLLNSSKQIEVGLMHAEQFAGLLKYDYLGLNYQIDSLSSAAFTVIRSGVDNIQNSLDAFDKDGNLDYNRITNFSVADYAFIFSYAHKSKIPNLDYGLNFKFIYRNEGEFAKGLGFGVDLGAQYKKGKWQFGAMLSDITTTFTFWNLNEEALMLTFETDSTLNTISENTIDLTMPSVSLGAARNFKISKKIGAKVELGAKIYFDGQQNSLLSSKVVSLLPSLGAEFDYQKFIFFRFGFGNFQNIEDFDQTRLKFQPNLGVGFFLKGFTLDYALTDIGSQIVSYSNIFSLKYNFNANFLSN